MLRLYHAVRNEPNFLWKSRNDLFALLLAKQERYIFFDKKIMYDVLACWIVGTYLFPMFACFPYLILVGAKKSGKSTVLDFLSLICWNATKRMACPSESSLFRLVQCAKPTQLIDEIHRLLLRPDISGALQSVLEVGFEKEGVVPRVDKENRVVELFDVYSPKALASREKLEVEDKGIVFVMQPATDVRYGKARQSLVFERELPALRIELIKFALTHWKEIKKEYEKLQPNDKLYGRDFLLFAPLLAICKVVSPDKFEDMVEYAERASAEKIGEAWESENLILSCLLSRADEVGSYTYLTKVRDWLGWKNWQPVYSAFRNLGIVKKSADSKRGRRYYLDWEKIKNQAEARGIEIESETEEETIGEGALKFETIGEEIEKKHAWMKKGTCPICGEWGELDQRTLKDGSEIYSCLLCYKDRNGKIEEEHRKTQNSRSKRLEFVEDRLKEYEEFERWKQLEKEQKELDDL
jgi:hypothetical protein